MTRGGEAPEWPTGRHAYQGEYSRSLPASLSSFCRLRENGTVIEEGFEFGIGIVEIVRDASHADGSTKLTRLLWLVDGGHDFGNGSASPGNENLITVMDLLKKLGELSLRVVDVVGASHSYRLANLSD